MKIFGDTSPSKELDLSLFKENVFCLEGVKKNYEEEGTAYTVSPKKIEGKIPLLLCIHGSGRGALDYRDEPFYRTQRDYALKNGYLFAALSNGPDTWGLDDGLNNTLLFLSYLREHFPLAEKMVLWPTSAGGTLCNRIVSMYPETVDFVIGTFPVYDLLAGFSLDHCKNAWGTKDTAEFKELIKGKNPADFPEKLSSTTYYISHGDKDIHVPIKAHSERMAKEVGKNVHLFVIKDGVHSTENYAYYDMLK